MVRLLALLGALALAACLSQPAAQQHPVTHQGIEFRLKQGPEAPGATVFMHAGTEVFLGPAAPYEISTVYTSIDVLGLPALGFEIADQHKAEFTRWTGEHVNEQIAILIDGEIITIPQINEALPGEGIINGGAGGFTADEVDALIARLTQ